MALESNPVVNKLVDNPVNNRCLQLRRLQIWTAAIFFALSSTFSVFATDYTWDGGSPGPANDKWSIGANWGIPDAADVPPPINNVAGLTNANIFFSGSLRLDPKVDQTYFIRSLTFNASAGAHIIGPQNSEILRIGAGGIVNNSTNTQTMLISLSLSNSQTWDARFGGLNFQSVLLNSHSLSITGLYNTRISNIISGAGSLTKRGAGTLFLAGPTPNTFSGGFVLDAGAVVAQKANALGSGAVTVNDGTLDIGTHAQTVGAVTLNSGVINGSTGIITGSTYQVHSGTINARLGGSAGMTKLSSGTVTLTSSNSYSGGTTINAGKLRVDNTSGSGTGSGNVTINNSGVLAGSGIISGNVTNKSGGTISPGDVNHVAQLRTGNQTWEGGATNILEMKDVDLGMGTGWDVIDINGGLNVTATSGNKFILDLRSLSLAESSGLVNDFDSAQDYIWTIARTVSGITFPLGEDESTVFQILLGAFSNPLNGGVFSIATANSGKDLNLVYNSAPVPEPSAFMLMFLGFGVLLWRWRWGSAPR